LSKTVIGKQKLGGEIMRKKYLSELIGEDFKTWEGKKVLITAPTGMGKSTFVVKKLLPFHQEQNKKLLILCNRRLLREQYWCDLVCQYSCFTDLEESVQLMTYQELVYKSRNHDSINCLLSDFQTIVCDECHYFYSDSDFNGYGTFALLQMIVCGGIEKQIIFLSATMDEVKPLIKQIIYNFGTVESDNFYILQKRNVYAEYKEIVDLDFSSFEDYQRFQCLSMPDEPTLCDYLANSPQKSLVFIDSKDRACKMREKLLKSGKLGSQDVAILHSDNIDSPCNSELVQHLSICHKLLPKILITTAVLDNGVSIHDEEMGNVVIITESKISFLQMLGRVRAESVNRCNLIFVIRSKDVFLNRKNKYEQNLEEYKKLERMNLNRNMGYFDRLFWDNTNELVDFYRSALVKMPYEYQFFIPHKWVHIKETSGKEELYINQFAKIKTGNMYLIESRFYSMAVVDPLKVIYEQMSWIGKEPYELCTEDSSYLEERRQQFIEYLLSVQDYTNKELQEFKQKLVKEYRNDFFNDIPAKNGTLSTEKLKEICERMGLVFDEKENSENRNKLYSIAKQE